MDWTTIGVAIATSLGTGLMMFGTLRSTVDGHGKTIDSLRTRQHDLGNDIQLTKLKQAIDINDMRKESYAEFVTQRQFEAFVAATSSQLTEVRTDVKKLLEMVAKGN